MAYSNAIYYIDPENGADCADLTVVIASNPSGSITRMTKAGHSLRTGTFVTASAFTAWLNGEWKITVVDADNFDLDGAVWQATADASGSIATQMTLVTVANPSGSITRCTKTAHGLEDGGYVTLSFFTAWLNGAWQISVVDADNFDLVGAVWTTTGDASGTVNPHRGGSKADAWKTFTTGASAARIQPGDVIRVMASPDETEIGEATWNQYSKTITLAGAVTANITDCETAWIGSANVTQTADTAVFKENTKAAKSVIAAGFTTGLVAYFATGTLDLSAYQQISLWVRSTAAIAASTLSLRLCSDAVGVTTVHTIAIPANPAGNAFMPVTVDLGSAMNSAIASVALYADLDPGAVTVYLDNIIACKAPSGADALSLTSLLGKVWNLCWVASATYAANAIRKPTQPNRNGYRYKVTAGGGGAAGSTEPTWPQEIGATVVDGALTWTCEGLEDTWYGIQSINGTTVKLDNGINTLGSAGRGYSGATETIATYKRQPTAIQVQSSSLSNTTMTVQDSGTAGSSIMFSGGWNRTDMTTQTGETWVDGQNGVAVGISGYANNLSYVDVENMNSTRCAYGVHFYNWKLSSFRNCHHNNAAGNAWYLDASSDYGHALTGCAGLNGGSNGMFLANTVYAGGGLVQRMSLSGNIGDGYYNNNATNNPAMRDIVAVNNGGYGINNLIGDSGFEIANLVTANNASGGVNSVIGKMHLTNASIAESTEFGAMGAFANEYIYSQKHDQTADNHLITTDGGTIVSATDQRHTASGISWKFRPTSTNRGAGYPLRLSVAKKQCAASVAVNVTIWTRRDSTDINGTLKIKGGQIAGIPVDVSVACAPSINTWAQSSTLTVTPTEAGVIEIIYECYDGVGTTNNLWIDDIEIT